MSSRRPQDVFKTFWGRLQNIFKMSWKSACKTFWRRLQDILEMFCKDVFNTFQDVLLIKLFLLTLLRDVLQRRLSTEVIAYVTGLRNIWSVYKICKSDKNFSSFSSSLYCTFYWLLTEAYLEPGRTSTIELFWENT